MDRREFIMAAALTPILPALPDTAKPEEIGQIAQSLVSFPSLQDNLKIDYNLEDVTSFVTGRKRTLGYFINLIIEYQNYIFTLSSSVELKEFDNNKKMQHHIDNDMKTYINLLKDNRDCVIDNLKSFLSNQELYMTLVGKTWHMCKLETR